MRWSKPLPEVPDQSPERLLTLIQEKFPEATPAEIAAAVRVLDDPDFIRRGCD
jgi:hypothetical protein